MVSLILGMRITSAIYLKSLIVNYRSPKLMQKQEKCRLILSLAQILQEASTAWPEYTNALMPTLPKFA